MMSEERRLRYNKYMREYQMAHKDKMKAKARAYYLSNTESCKARSAKWRKENPQEKYMSNRDRVAKRRGITLAEYNAILDAQGGVCAICLRPPGKFSLAIDHCHSTDKNRGLLCGRCNTALSLVENYPEWADRAVSYLAKHALAEYEKESA